MHQKPQTSWSETFQDATGAVRVIARADLFTDEAEMQSACAELVPFAARVPLSPKWPMIVLRSMEATTRGTGLGTTALRAVLEKAKEAGFVSAILQLGFDASTSDGWSDAARLNRWYQREGFRPMMPGAFEQVRADILFGGSDGAWRWYWRAI